MGLNMGSLFFFFSIFKAVVVVVVVGMVFKKKLRRWERELRISCLAKRPFIILCICGVYVCVWIIRVSEEIRGLTSDVIPPFSIERNTTKAGSVVGGSAI
ncbi:hypothetical protein B0T19DRAFT_427251 [Cercophora scortea]|uniref:Uncharacterized protein n=1 Tax=Cercophora scortea TaxID=314031 RepID=A0AAE0IF92_9PEZI|nr:hypothetical protein B0T19DRAFT_427251 [Cercophora scortea]